MGRKVLTNSKPVGIQSSNTGEQDTVEQDTVEQDMGFQIKAVKRIAGDCKQTHRWARVKCEATKDLYTYRIIGIGRKYVRLMSNDGTIWNELPKNFTRVW